MKIKEAKENVMKNFRANYTNDHMALHDIEIFLLNTLEQMQSVVIAECLRVVPKDREFKHKECLDGTAECCENCLTKGFINEWLRATRQAITKLKKYGY